MTDVFTPLLLTGVKRLGGYAADWVKGPAPERLAAALAARMQENEYQLLSFQSLVNDEEYRLLVEDVNEQLQFDEARAAAILRRHVDDIRGDVQTDQLVERVAALLHALLPLFASGGSKALALQTGLHHQDALKTQRALDENRKALQEIQGRLASITAASGGVPAVETVIFDRQWLSGRASDAWRRLLDEYPDGGSRSEAGTRRRANGSADPGVPRLRCRCPDPRVGDCGGNRRRARCVGAP
jgi:hypothetical protein